VYYIFENYLTNETMLSLLIGRKDIKKNKNAPNVNTLKTEYLMIFYFGNTSL